MPMSPINVDRVREEGQPEDVSRREASGANWNGSQSASWLNTGGKWWEEKGVELGEGVSEGPPWPPSSTEGGGQPATLTGGLEGLDAVGGSGEKGRASPSELERPCPTPQAYGR